ncbi:MAG: MBL fold metallo-hydrolase [Gammaproteobacteria bacterium]|nr:MBL fold metallo-hydrolase [Gammaproteobacteria bacterium]MDH5800586.1 MBL fold metallo-hydrolase [Gammaproteobacteria bacterium]
MQYSIFHRHITHTLPALWMALWMALWIAPWTSHAADLSITKDYPLTQLSKRVWVIHGPNEEVSKANQGFRNNPVFISSSKGLIVVDPGSSVHIGEMIVNKAKTISNKPIIAIFNTHGHGDHWLANHGIKNHYPKAVIYAHAKMKTRLESGDADMWLKAIEQRTEGMSTGTKAYLPEKSVNDGEVLSFGDVRIKVFYSGAGHSDHDIMLHILEDKVFVFGDNLRNENISLFMASFNGNLASLDVGLQSGAEIFIPGHGASGDKRIIQSYRQFIRALKAEVKRHYEDGLSDFEMKPKIIKSLLQSKQWSGFEENIGRLINLAYLEIEQESF